MKRLFLFLGDVVILYASLYLTLFLRYGRGFEGQIALHLVPFSLVFIFWLLTFYIANLYELGFARNIPEFYSSLFKAIAVSAAIAVFFFYLAPVLIPTFRIAPRRNLFIYIAVFTSLVSLWRYLYNKILLRTSSNNTIIVGFDQTSFELAKFLNENPQYGYKLKYALDASEEAAFSFQDIDFRHIRGARDIERLLEKENINTIILSPGAYRLPDIVEIFYKAVKRGVNFLNTNEAYERVIKRVPLNSVNQIWFLENITGGRKKFYEFVKRILDIVLAIIGGAALLVLFPFVAFAIKWESEGSIFYRQRRVGRQGKTFEIIKYRTMMKDAEKLGAVWAEKKDPRVTKLGRFLRKSRLDELPQIWNILKGEMSFVGPRAERPEFVEKLKKEVPFYEERLLVRPGASGWAQINYGKELTSADTREKLQYDLYYIKNRSLTLDLAVILKTIKTILSGAGW